MSNSFRNATSRRKSIMPMFSNALITLPADKANITIVSRPSPINPASGHAMTAISSAVRMPRTMLRPNPVSYIARSRSGARTSASCTPIADMASTELMMPVASATRPKSAGCSSRTRISVLTSPMFRVATRHAMIQPAPAAVRCDTEGPRPPSLSYSGNCTRGESDSAIGTPAAAREPTRAAGAAFVKVRATS